MTDYTNYNYEELVQAVTEKVQDANGWGDGYTSSMGQTIIQTIAFTVDQLHYMLERRNQESYLPTAVLPSSVRSIANTQGYRPRRKVSSRGTVRLDLEDENGAPTSAIGSINIPRYTRVVWENNEFLVNEDVTIEPGESSAEFEIVQGTFQQYEEDPDDTTTNLYKHNFVLFTEYTNIEDTTLEVEVDGEQYFDVAEERNDQPALESLSFAGENDRVYDVRIANDGLRVLFGGGLFGKFPDDPVTITWVESRGSEVNIRRTGIEFFFEEETLTDDIQQTPRNRYYYTMENIENIDGGLEEEDTRTIKTKAPEFVRTGNRAVTKDDYVFWGKRSGIGGIVDVFVYGEEETGVTAFNMNNVYMTYLTNDGTSLNTTERNNLRTYMNGLKPITTHMVFREAEQIPLKINLTVRRHPKLEISNSELYSRLHDELKGLFTFEEGSLAKDFFYSELINHFHTLKLDKNGKTYDMTQYVYASITPMKEFEVPSEEPYETDSSYSITIAVGDEGDEYTLNLTYTDNNDDMQSAEVSYTQQSGDSSSIIASELQSQIDALSGLTASVSSSTITIDVENSGDTYTVSNRNSTQTKNIPIEAIVYLPIRILKNENNLELIKPGSIEIRENFGDFSLLGTDDSAGSITIGGNSGSIDYTTGKMEIPVYEKGDYVIVYEQDNDEQNVFANPKSVITFSDAKEKISDATEKLSTIEIIS